MHHIVTFYPIPVEVSLFDKIVKWTLGLAFVAFIIVKIILLSNFSFGIITIFVVTFVAFMVKNPISVTISLVDKTLEYSYTNVLGRKATTIVDLRNAAGSYKYELYSKLSAGWRLLLYNKNYFHNRVSIEERVGGFNKYQLDQIVALVHECSGNNDI